MTQHPTDFETAERQAFARKLTDLMARRGLSQSDLARAVWGSTTDSRSRDVARNRDRISHYVRGSQMPEAKTMKLLAEALGVPVSELQPGEHRTGVNGGPTEMGMTVLAGRSDLALLVVNKTVPTELAARILAMLAQEGRNSP